MTSGPGLSVAAVAHRLGVAPSTLRTWDRRYGLGPSGHASGTHRRYRPEDLARLEVMRRLVVQGVPPGEAAREALTTAATEGPPPSPAPAATISEEAVRGLARAAVALDAAAVQSAVRDALRAHGVIATWERLLVPVLVGAGVRWETTGEGVDIEHLLCTAISRALHQHAPEELTSPRPALLACAPGDLHDLPLQALAAALAERGQATRLLGASVPLDALRSAVRRTSPAALVVWAQRPATADVDALTVPATRPRTVPLAAGPGWQEPLPPGVVRLGGLGAATDVVSSVLKGLPVPSST